MSFVRIGTGLTFAEYEWINSKPWKPLDRKRPPPWMRISTTTGTEDAGDVYLEPHECARILSRMTGTYAEGIRQVFHRLGQSCGNHTHGSVVIWSAGVLKD